MPREIDEPIPDDERLFRGLKAEHMDGSRVLPEAIDMQGTSTVRAKYGTAEQARSEERNEVGVGFTTPGQLPPRIVLGDTTWEWFAVDDPFDGNEGHAELRAHPLGHVPPRDHVRPKSGSKKEELRRALANSFRVLDSD